MSGSQQMGERDMSVATVQVPEVGNAVEAAIWFVAGQPGGARRILLSTTAATTASARAA